MTNEKAFKEYFDNVEAYLKDDASSKNQKMPQTFKQEVSEDRGVLYGASHLKYLVFGRGPGKMPPTDKIEEWLRNAGLRPPERNAKGRFIKLNYQSLAFAIASKIASEGTMIFKGEKPGIDFVGAIEKNKPDLLKSIARNQAINIRTIIHNAAKMVVVCLLFSSCSAKINLTKEERKVYEAKKFARFKISQKDVALNTISFFVGYSIGKEVRKRIDVK